MPSLKRCAPERTFHHYQDVDIYRSGECAEISRRIPAQAKDRLHRLVIGTPTLRRLLRHLPHHGRGLPCGKSTCHRREQFLSDRFVDLAENVEIKPAVNQLRTNVFSQQWDAETEMVPYGTRIMAWAPLAQSSEELFSCKVLKEMAAAHGKTVTQVALRYLLQRNIIAIPKTTHRDRMEENLQVFDFSLSETEMEAINRSIENKISSSHIVIRNWCVSVEL